MSMDCREAILSDDYVDYVWKVNTGSEESAVWDFGECFEYVSPNFSVFYVKRKDFTYDRNAMPVGDYGITYCHTQMDTESLEDSRILTIQNQPALQLRGNGVILGFLDSGIALEQQVFRTSGGATRVIGLWDQTDQSGEPPENFHYGSEYTKEDIDVLLMENASNLPGRDENGHGTRLAALAGGSQIEGGSVYNSPAFRADILVVKLKPAKEYLREYFRIPDGVPAYASTDMMMAIKYLQTF